MGKKKEAEDDVNLRDEVVMEEHKLPIEEVAKNYNVNIKTGLSDSQVTQVKILFVAQKFRFFEILIFLSESFIYKIIFFQNFSAFLIKHLLKIYMSQFSCTKKILNWKS